MGDSDNMTLRLKDGACYYFSYDVENRLTGVNGAVNATFVFDGDGNRVKFTIGTSTVVYLGNYFMWTGSTSSMKKYYYASGQRVAMRHYVSCS